MFVMFIPILLLIPDTGGGEVGSSNHATGGRGGDIGSRNV